MTDPIADMLTRIRNAALVNKTKVQIPFSKMKHSLAVILKEEGFITNFESVTVLGMPMLEIVLKYSSDGVGVINSLKRISKPGRRVYTQKKSLPFVLNGFGIAILSTPQGLMTNKQAHQKNLGGEIICEIY